jgi:hypothetical protein
MLTYLTWDYNKCTSESLCTQIWVGIGPFCSARLTVYSDLYIMYWMWNVCLYHHYWDLQRLNYNPIWATTGLLLGICFILSNVWEIRGWRNRQDPHERRPCDLCQVITGRKPSGFISGLDWGLNSSIPVSLYKEGHFHPQEGAFMIKMLTMFY